MMDPTAEDLVQLSGNQTPYGGQMTCGGDQTRYGGQMTCGGDQTRYGGQMTCGGDQTRYGGQMTCGGDQTRYGGQMTCGGDQTHYGGQMTCGGDQTRYGGQMTCGGDQTHYGGQMTALKGGYPLTFTGNHTFTGGQVTTHSSDKTLYGGFPDCSSSHLTQGQPLEEQKSKLKTQRCQFKKNLDISKPYICTDQDCKKSYSKNSYLGREDRFTGAVSASHGETDLLPLIGLGPHTSRKKPDLDKLYELKSKAPQNQFGPSALINLSNLSAIKREPVSTPPQGSMANSTTVVTIPGTPGSGGRLSPEDNQVLTKKKLQDLVREVDPNEELDDDVEEMLLPMADGFIESVVPAACQLARQRESSTLEVKDGQLHLQCRWNTCLSGFGSEEIRPYRKACTTEAHKQRMALIREITKK
ncbi:Kruppel-like factor 18 [Myotis daubentonii]|uniref:Kruppel-like factor 18 n=1 Tax=Myotis daubentonii TaxID=98922 RepID=UPI002873979B|nr:Kruppel-like factor 18 [Myotis daubentonii]